MQSGVKNAVPPEKRTRYARVTRTLVVCSMLQLLNVNVRYSTQTTYNANPLRYIYPLITACYCQLASFRCLCVAKATLYLLLSLCTYIKIFNYNYIYIYIYKSIVYTHSTSELLTHTHTHTVEHLFLFYLSYCLF